MSTKPQRPQETERPSEGRLLELREEALRRGKVSGLGVRPPGAPFPQASSETGYYGVPMLKEPAWTWQVPLYFFVGGAAGSAGVLGAVADWVGDDYELARDARWVAIGGAALSGALLTWDLGRPSRFLNMLRVFKPQSPMSVGAWVLTAFANFAAAAKFADIVGERFGNSTPVKIMRGMGNLGALAFGLPFHNYTGVLIGATAIPVWNKKVGSLPRHFGMSGLQACVSILELMGHEDSRALNMLGLLSAVVETWEGYTIELARDRVLDPLKRGGSGWATRAGGLLSGPIPLVLRMLAWNSPELRRAAAWSGILGSIITRIAWIQAGHVSARDWRLPLEIEGSRTKPQPIPENVPKKFRIE
jgi:hypothetical protein